MGIIRLLLAVFVVIHHSYSPFGYLSFDAILAVQAFFVISGFYMTLILKEKYINKNGSYFLFLSNRFLRIYPTYWLILFCTIGLSYFWFYTGQQSGFNYYQQLYHYTKNDLFLYAKPLDILRDITLLFRFDYFQINDNLHDYLLLGQAWTLVVELLFYIVAPFVVKKIKIIVPFFFLSLLIHYAIEHYALTHQLPLTDRFFPAELFYFLLGSLSYYFYKWVEQKNISHSIISGITGGFIAFTFLYRYLPIDAQIRWIHMRDVYYITALTVTIPFIFLFSKKNKLDRYIGELSYPVYLIHTTIFLIIMNSPLSALNKSYLGMLTIIFSIISSLLLVRFFERFIEKWRQSRLRNTSKSRESAPTPKYKLAPTYIAQN